MSAQSPRRGGLCLSKSRKRLGPAVTRSGSAESARARARAGPFLEHGERRLRGLVDAGHVSRELRLPQPEVCQRRLPACRAPRIRPEQYVAAPLGAVRTYCSWVAMKKVMTDDGAFGFLRVLGASMARLAEAESAVVRARSPNLQMTHSHDELITAQAYRQVAEFIPRIGALIDAVHRHHLISARTHFEGVLRDTSETVVCGIGFADLSGFTALTQQLTPAELSKLLSEFSATVTDVVHADGGRVVKFIGDEVMWVSSTPERLAKAAADLVDHPKAREAHMQVRAGLDYGTVLAVGGDYFGNSVNLAARLVAAAEPGQILATSAVRDELPDWPAAAQEPLTLKGFDTPVTAFDLRAPG